MQLLYVIDSFICETHVRLIFAYDNLKCFLLFDNKLHREIFPLIFFKFC